MKILVQKYGGTSVTTPEKRSLIFQRVKDALEEGFKVVLVVSAMGRRGPHATDTLRALALGEYDDLSLRELDLIMSCGEIYPLWLLPLFSAPRDCGPARNRYSGRFSDRWTLWRS